MKIILTERQFKKVILNEGRTPWSVDSGKELNITDADLQPLINELQKAFTNNLKVSLSNGDGGTDKLKIPSIKRDILVGDKSLTDIVGAGSGILSFIANTPVYGTDDNSKKSLSLYLKRNMERFSPQDLMTNKEGQKKGGDAYAKALKKGIINTIRRTMGINQKYGNNLDAAATNLYYATILMIAIDKLGTLTGNSFQKYFDTVRKGKNTDSNNLNVAIDRVRKNLDINTFKSYVKKVQSVAEKIANTKVNDWVNANNVPNTFL